MGTKKILATTMVGLMASTAAFAQNNNTGEIVIQGVVPGVWELTVYDINSGYDFDLSLDGGDGTGTGPSTTENTDARVGTIHISANTTGTTFGSNPNALIGLLMIESANAGRMINNQSLPGIAAEHQDYVLSLEDNGLATNDLTVEYDDQAALATMATLSTTAGSATLLNMNTPRMIEFSGGVIGTYDVVITLGGVDSSGTAIDTASDVRPLASGVYEDVLTFTIMDDA
jgi:hypothetical protein